VGGFRPLAAPGGPRGQTSGSRRRCCSSRPARRAAARLQCN